MAEGYKISLALKKQIYFVIPAYNEEKVISKVMNNLIKEGYNNIIVIDDGSTDKISKKVLEYKNKGVILLRHIINRGQGAALKTGIDYALRQKNCKYIVTFDSDGQHRISDLPKFIGALEKKNYDLAIGSRFLDKKSKKLIPMKKRTLLKGALIVTMFLSKIKLTDTHNGYRVLTKKAAGEIEITMDGFEHASEIIDEIARKKLKFVEVPTFIDYTEYSKAKGQKISNSLKIFLKMVLGR